MRFLEEHREHPAALVLRVLGIPASTYYGWRERRARPPRRALEDAVLLEKIKEIRASSEFVTPTARRGCGWHCAARASAAAASGWSG